MIRFERVSVTYTGATRPVLREVDFEVPEGELALVIGPTGSGKSTLLSCVNGLVPHFTGGRLAGRVTVDGRDTRDHPPRELADVVGWVGQDPVSTFVTDTVEDELAFVMESLALPPAVMRRRVEEVVDLLGLADLRDRPLLSLSAGQQQRVAIGSVLTAAPRVLVLDEPTSALDPGAAEEVLAAITRMVHDLGLTVLLAEHRLERVVQYADRVAVVAGGIVRHGDPATLLASAPVAPPVVELGRLAGVSPLPLSVRSARQACRPLREQLETRGPAGRSAALEHREAAIGGELVVSVEGLWVSHGPVVALRGIDLAVTAGEVVALMGRNGAGKSTLLHTLAGIHRPVRGTARVGGEPTAGRPAKDVVRRIALVPQQPGDLLWAQTVAEECDAADRAAGLPGGATAGLLDRISPGIDPATHPRDLSEGQRLALALAVVGGLSPAVLALDEPTRGLDYAAKGRLVRILRARVAEGATVLLATHDVELAVAVADRIVVLADGEVVTDGPVREIATASPLFAPQVAKVMAPLPLLTVADVEAALA